MTELEQLRTTIESLQQQLAEAPRRRQNQERLPRLSEFQIAERYAAAMNNLAFDKSMQGWRKYDDDSGLWTPIIEESLVTDVGMFVSDAGWSPITVSSGEKIVKILKAPQFMPTINFDNNVNNRVAFQNGVLDIATGELLSHGPEHGLTSLLPYEYDAAATCPKTYNWLLWATNGEPELVEVLIAITRATITGRSDLKVFLEVAGEADSGKSTFLRLLEATVGRQNTVATNIESMCGDRFDTARYYGKRLIVLPDVSSFGKNAEVLKQLTGGDALKYEAKHKNAGTFVYWGMIAMSTNSNTLYLGENSSALNARRIMVPFNNRIIGEARKLVDYSRDGIGFEGDLVPEIPGFINLALRMTDKRMRDLLRGGKSEVLEHYRLRQAVAADTLATWANELLIASPDEMTGIGYLREGTADENMYRLFPSYDTYCSMAGVRKPVSKTFTDRLISILTTMAGLKGIEKVTVGGSNYITGVRVRVEKNDDHIPTLITKEGGIDNLGDVE